MTESPLLVNLAYALGAAFIGAAIATRLGQSAILGYILAGIAIGPFTPGFVADADTVQALADIGVIFLLFAIGVQLSFRDLLRVGKVAILGGSIQIAALIGIGYGLGIALGWTPMEALFLGAVVSNSSSTVLGKIVGERGEAGAQHAQVGLAWSTVQDLSTIVLVVVLSALVTGGGNIVLAALWAVGKAGLFLLLLIPIGLRVFPQIFDRVAALRNREVFILAVAAVALATAYLSSFFGLSLALGAFVAGVVVGESDLSHQILGEVVPLRDILAGLFFVSVGMLVDPRFLLDHLWAALLIVLLIVVVKGLLTALITAGFGYPRRTALLTGVTLAQSAEFSFLLARLGADLGAVGPTVFSLMLAGAAGSIILAPSLHRLAGSGAGWLDKHGFPTALSEDEEQEQTTRHSAVVCGYRRVGSVITEALRGRGISCLVIDHDPQVVRKLREEGVSALQGRAENPLLLERAGVDRAAILVVAVPEALATRQIVEYARQSNPRIDILARAHTEEEIQFLRSRGVSEAMQGERELAVEMAGYALRRFGVSPAERLAIMQGLRRRT